MTAPQITSQFIDAAIDHAFRVTMDKRSIVMDEVIDKVSAKMGVTAGDIIGPSQKKIHVRPRWIAMWACRQQGIPYAVIGRHFGGRDHQTVTYAVKQIDAQVGGLK